jgi:hypothetical protein
VKQAERTVRQVVADTIVALVVGGVIDNTATAITKAFVAAGLGRDDIALADKRYREGAGLFTVPYATGMEFDPCTAPPPRLAAKIVQPVEEPPPLTANPEPGNPGAELDAQLADGEYERRREAERGSPLKQKPTQLRPDRIGPDTKVRELCCTECAEWKPTTDFRERADRPGLFTARCRKCLSGYVRAKYVSAKVEESLGKVNLRFVLDEESNLVGLACVDCGRPFTGDDEVVGESFFTHRECPQ